MRSLILVLLLAGCATKLQPKMDMANFNADCRYSSIQVSLLHEAIENYEQSGLDDYPYYQQLKNNYWSLKTMCVNLRNS